MHSEGRSRALDGLRAIGALSVMAFHLGWLPFGWMGVPLFFVLSGYLVTQQLERGLPTLEFYRRRFVRIAPALYVYLAVNAVATVAVGMSLTGYGWHLAMLSNFIIAATTPNTTGGLIGHLWSVSVEAQFYLIWPLLFGRRALVWALIPAALLFRLIVPQAWAITSLGGCIDMFAIGGLIAVVRGWKAYAAIGAAGAAILAYTTIQSGAAFNPLSYTGIGLLSAVLIRYSDRLPLVGRLSGVGRISYGLYLWHMLTFTIATRLTGHPLWGVPICFALAWGSHRWLERGHVVLSTIQPRAAWDAK